MSKKPRMLGDVLTEVLNKYGLSDRIKEFDAVNAWVEVVGEDIARRTKAIIVRDGTLIVEVSNSVWRNELFYLKAEIIEKLNHRIGKKIIHDINFV